VRNGATSPRFLVNYFPVGMPDDDARAVGMIALDVSARHEAERVSREQARVAETLHAIGRALTAETDLERIVQADTDAVTEMTGAQFGAFFYNVVDDDGEAYTLYTLSGVPREAFSKFPMPRNTPVFAPTFYGEGVVRSDDITRDHRYGHMEPHHGMPKGHLPVRSYLAVPVTSSSGRVLGGLFFGHEAVGVFDDRDERLATGVASWAAVAMDNAWLLEAERRARAEAERANRVKSDFLAVMSHELRTPLNAIIGYAGLLEAGVPEPIPAHARPKVDRINFSAKHLLELIDEILTFARLDAGEERAVNDTVDVQEMLSGMEAMIEPLALAKGIDFQCVASDPVTFTSDAKKIRQVLINLLTNAVKFTAEGHVRLEAERDADDVVFSVSDTGPGIPPEARAKIFDAFWQVENDATRRVGGTGLGLSVARRLARLLGGDIEVESAIGEGSTFRLRLPIEPPLD
jgi:signal transduction histidine kinase